mmetsp:Transcript_25181/g.62079  ORF Transcript_25181/g.62079 Transcript_25181/m.62079 type:complete len:125 (-) Transcript_25181:237-611(-)|eukprot:CAMPEP_0113625478 /NCGR_PEP_ID=MMETSP0017_2-20120614/13163_1 /TAXON_ID=2856 /ORGANISM="Cylindrotheca closterium" /LENGTH=124 /DNA_ID=CAMNT_0000535599 /DNA_START=143 /DNA_END=517 /DNA_ORIENTATION=- /assembly_acc=CAM_ASM_000147
MADSNTDPVESALDKLKPIVSKISFGSVVGYCSGMALKKVGKAVAFVIGVGFIGVQSAVYSGYITVDWGKVSGDAMKPLDTTGDGKVDIEDAKEWWKRLKAMLTSELPGAGGFSLGFLTGVRYG